MSQTKEGIKLLKTWNDAAIGDEVTCHSLIKLSGMEVTTALTALSSCFLCRRVRQGLAEKTKKCKDGFDKRAMFHYQKIGVQQCVKQQTDTRKLVITESDDRDKILYGQLRNFTARLGINIIGEKRSDAILLVLDEIVVNYRTAKKGRSKEGFELYKRQNDDMLSWFNENKDYEPLEEDPKQKYEEPEEFRDELKPEDVSEEVLAKDTEFTVLQLGESILKVIDDYKSEIFRLNGALNQESQIVQELVEEKQRIEDLYKQAQEKIIELNSTKNTKVFKLADLQAFHSRLAAKG